jgi:hypothetical protein
LIVFRDNDAISACFDQDLEQYYEVSHEPTFAVVARLGDKQEFDEAVRTLTVFLRLNKELFELVGLLNKWEETNERQHQHRPEPSLRAA